MNYFRKKYCHFCRKKIAEIDFYDTQLIRRFLSPWGKIRPAANTGACRKHQRKLTKAVKYARFLALLPYVSR